MPSLKESNLINEMSTAELDAATEAGMKALDKAMVAAGATTPITQLTVILAMIVTYIRRCAERGVPLAIVKALLMPLAVNMGLCDKSKEVKH